LSLGAARAGFTVCGCVELDAHAIKAHKINFPNTLHIEEDIRTLTGDILRQKFNLAANELTGIIGGPPCQGFSHIGAKDTKDSRNQLFGEFFRLVNELSPAFFLAENVPGILNPKNAKIIESAQACVKNEFHILPPLVLSAKDFGAPTTRTRVFFIGYKPSIIRELTPDDFEPMAIPTVTVKDALKGLPTHISPSCQDHRKAWRKVKYIGDNPFTRRLYDVIPDGVGDGEALRRLSKESVVSGCLGTVHSTEVSARYAKVAPGESDKVSKSPKLSLEGFCPTLRAGTGPEHGSFQAVRPLHPTKNRVITPREAARLQGFPDWFQFAPTKWHSFRQIGNSVSPILSEYILSILNKNIKKTTDIK